MRSSLGISTGASGVCAALVTTDESGTRSVEYRTISTDSGTDIGSLALSAIGLMTTQIPDRRIEPDAIAVAYRTDGEAAAVRAAARNQRRSIRLVPEVDAALEYLRSTGLVDRYGHIALADLGASGLTVTIVDPADGTISVRDRVADIDRDTASDHDTARTASRTAEFVHHVAKRSLRTPEAVVLVGGGANTPGPAAALGDTVGTLPVLVVDEPEAATAKGAALLAGSAEHHRFPVVTGTGSRVSAAAIGAFAIGALILGYCVTEMIPNAPENFSPAGSLVDTPEVVTELPPAPEPPAPAPGNTYVPTGDPSPTSTWQAPNGQWPPTTYSYPTTTEPRPTTDTTPTSTSPTPPPSTPPPTTGIPSPTTTTKDPLPWIPPKWPERPTWLPEFAPHNGFATPDAPTPDAPTPDAPAPDVPATPVRPDAGSAEIRPESGSPTPTVPDSSPR
ncbi:exopolyphosphatase [Prescottella subtropica]|uniref:exopolyphosphatase n=1 Tax=Prescottella subtropica TaxID=2545757 RepID=UPI0010F8FF7B|nr:exopolyphosphatase [Prescottella subtropica]